MGDTIHVLGEGGGIFEMSLPLPEPIAERLTKGHLKRVNHDGSPFLGAPEIVRPAVNAPKAEWVGWAVHNGVLPDDAEAMTKGDLVEKFGAPKQFDGVDLGSEEAKDVAGKFFEKPEK